MANSLEATPPRHGGNLDQAIEMYGGQQADWLDLSTGVSPWAYPSKSLTQERTQELWRNLPKSPDSLLVAAATYYDCDLSSISVTPGTQLAIRLLPTLVESHQRNIKSHQRNIKNHQQTIGSPQQSIRSHQSVIESRQRVAVPRLGYQEHRYAWQQAGHQIIIYESLNELETLVFHGKVDSAIVINPNNPSCDLIGNASLLDLAEKLPGLLIVDEAFADLDNTESVLSNSMLSNIIALRSLGKFFGLAGARIGFVISHHPIAKELNALLTPWSINGVAQTIAECALNDKDWQRQQAKRILKQAKELTELLKQYRNYETKNQGLFTTLLGDNDSLESLHHELAKSHIWTRLGDQHLGRNWLRFSLPGEQFQRLSRAIENSRLKHSTSTHYQQ